MSNIVLIGMSGAGKSTIGEILSLRIGKTFKDMDFLIEKKEGISIEEIFKLKGENYFRSLEEELSINLSLSRDSIISTGGGVILNPKNIENLGNNSKIFFLNASIDTLMRNLNISKVNRPLLSGNDLRKKVEALYLSRISLYLTYADFVIDVNNREIAEIVEDIINKC